MTVWSTAEKARERNRAWQLLDTTGGCLGCRPTTRAVRVGGERVEQIEIRAQASPISVGLKGNKIHMVNKVGMNWWS